MKLLGQGSRSTGTRLTPAFEKNIYQQTKEFVFVEVSRFHQTRFFGILSTESVGRQISPEL